MTDLKETIQHDIIHPNYIEEITSFIKGRSNWRMIGICAETLSKLSLGVSTILSFSSYAYSDQHLGFYSGSMSTFSLVSFQFATFSFRESKRATEHLNKLLTILHIDPIPLLSMKDTTPHASDTSEEKPNDLDEKSPV
jgi:hypothetical protein